jgi:hypothetical protein
MLELDPKTSFILLKKAGKAASEEKISFEPINSAVNRDNVDVCKDVVTPKVWDWNQILTDLIRLFEWFGPDLINFNTVTA